MKNVQNMQQVVRQVVPGFRPAVVQTLAAMITGRSAAALLATALWVAACGGGGGSTNDGNNGGTPVLGGSTTTPPVVVVVPPPPTAADLVVTLAAPTLPSVVASTVIATVTAVDANRATMTDIPVTLAVDGGATIKASGLKTDLSGRITGTVTLGNDISPHDITITATSGTLTRTAVVKVVSVTAADLTLTISPSASLSNSGTATVVATATAVDANRATVSGIPVTLSVDSGATVQISGPSTNGSGQVLGTVSIGEDKSNRTILVTAVSGNISRTAAVQVTGSKITATVLGKVLSPGQTGTVQYRLVDVNGNPMAGKRFVVTGPGGVQTVASTGLNGDYNYSFSAPATAGTVDVRASAAGVEDVQSVVVNTGPGTIAPATAVVRSASVSANPSVVAVNTPTTTNRAEVRALFLSDNNAPVPNIRVRFDLDNDAQSIGGSFTSGDTQVYSGANGVATAAYVPGGRFSPTDGVTVRACWDNNDFASTECPHAVRTTLTVINDALSVSMGTNNIIEIGDSKLTYVKRYVVQVVDSSGLAAAAVQVSASVDLPEYLKGVYAFDTVNNIWVQHATATCPNEDLNRNGVAEIFSNGTVEDANGSFNLVPGRPALEPRKADVAVSFEGGSKTSSSGLVVLRLEYPQNVASWVRFNLVVAASGVAGTEGRANLDSLLPVPEDSLTKKTLPPAFEISPYGRLSSPTIAAPLPGSTKPTVLLCTDPN